MFERFFKPRKKTVLRSPASEPAPSAGAGTGEAVAALSRAINGALQHHQAGRLSEAEAAYREALAIDPENIDALHFLGVIAFQRAEHERAAELISRALTRNASNAPAHNNLGNVFLAQGKLDEAIACYRKAVELAPDYVDPHFNMGNIFIKMQGKLDEAVACHQRVLTLMPDSPIAHSNLGNMLVEQGKRNEAIACYQKAIELKPDFPEAYSNLGSVLRDQGRLDEAIACYEEALELKPDFPEAHYNLGNVLKDVGRPEDAVRSYRQALALKPDAQTHSALLFSLNYIPGLCPADIYAEHRDYARCLYPIVASQLHDNIPDPGRRLRIGYVSGDFRMHPVAHFIEPVLAQHDHDRFEIFCYYNYIQTDAFTERLQNHADGWRDVFALNDEALAGLIRDDAIDILVDLSGHSGKNRLPVFGRKPAPVQATWLGYLNTTGLDAIDYRITDRYASPEGLFDAFHSERLLRLPGSQWCYQPPLNCPEVSAPPSAKTGGVTFAAFSNPAKIGRPVIELWSRLLARVPGSRLLIVAPGLA
ncbi:MAG: tetratricopeptide repeat protein, partial [Burkholderiales bacterium]